MAYPNLPPAPPPPVPENVGSTNVAFNTSLRMDLSYLTTPIGILRAVIVTLQTCVPWESILQSLVAGGQSQLHISRRYGVAKLFNVIVAICIGCSSFSFNGRGVFFTVVALSGLLYTLLIMYAYTFHAVEKYHNWRWLKVEVGAAVAFVFLNMIAATIAVAFGLASYSAAGFFGYLCMVSYGADAFLRARILRSGQPAQGQFFGYLCMVSYGADAFLRARILRSGQPAQGQVVTNKMSTNPRI